VSLNTVAMCEAVRSFGLNGVVNSPFVILGNENSEMRFESVVCASLDKFPSHYHHSIGEDVDIIVEVSLLCLF